MEKFELTELSFEKIAGTGDGAADALYYAAVLMLVGGIGRLFTASGKGAAVLGGGLIAAACLTYAHLLRMTLPEVRYFRYLWLDQDGVHHIEGSSPTDRTAHFPWHEIQSVQASDPYSEFHGIILTLNRTGWRGVPILLTSGHAEEAVRAINDFIAPAHVP